MQAYIELSTLLIRIHLITRLKNYAENPTHRVNCLKKVISLQRKALALFETVFEGTGVEIDVTHQTINGMDYDTTLEPEDLAETLRAIKKAIDDDNRRAEAMKARRAETDRVNKNLLKDMKDREELNEYDAMIPEEEARERLRVAVANHADEMNEYQAMIYDDDEAEAIMQEIEASRGIDRKRPRTMNERFPPAKRQRTTVICID